MCVSVCWVTLSVRPPLVRALSLEDNLRWILACCLLRFAAFLFLLLILMLLFLFVVVVGAPRNLHSEFDKNQFGIVVVVVVIVLLLLLFFRRISFIHRFFLVGEPELNI